MVARRPRDVTGTPGRRRIWSIAPPPPPRRSGITHGATAAGFLYLAVLLDVWSRKIVGWSMATICAPSWRWMRWTLPWASGAPGMSSTTATRAANTRPWRQAKRRGEAGVRPPMGSVGDAHDNQTGERGLDASGLSVTPLVEADLAFPGARSRSPDAMPSHPSLGTWPIRVVGPVPAATWRMRPGAPASTMSAVVTSPTLPGVSRRGCRGDPACRRGREFWSFGHSETGRSPAPDRRVRRSPYHPVPRDASSHRLRGLPGGAARIDPARRDRAPWGRRGRLRRPALDGHRRARPDRRRATPGRCRAAPVGAWRRLRCAGAARRPG